MKIHASQDMSDITSRDAEIERLVQEARRMRAQYMNQLVKDAFQGLVSLLKFRHSHHTGNHRLAH